MTILSVALIGAGVVFIASALDNTPIITTFQKILSGQKIDWTGGTTLKDAITPNTPVGPASGTETGRPKEPFTPVP